MALIGDAAVSSTATPCAATRQRWPSTWRSPSPLSPARGDGAVSADDADLTQRNHRVIGLGCSRRGRGPDRCRRDRDLTAAVAAVRPSRVAFQRNRVRSHGQEALQREVHRPPNGCRHVRIDPADGGLSGRRWRVDQSGVGRDGSCADDRRTAATSATTPATTAGASPEESAPADDSAPSGTLVVGLERDPELLDPNFARHVVADRSGKPCSTHSSWSTSMASWSRAWPKASSTSTILR